MRSPRRRLTEGGTIQASKVKRTAPDPLRRLTDGQLWSYRNSSREALVNYVRTHFGNHYTDKVTPAMVKTAR